MKNIINTSLKLKDIIDRLNRVTGVANVSYGPGCSVGEWHFKLDVDIITDDPKSEDFDGCLHVELSDDPDFEGGLGGRHTFDAVDFLVTCCSNIPQDLKDVLVFVDDDSANLCARYQLAH